MARVRYLGPEPVTVPELGGREVQPDEVVEVPDERFEGYVCQPRNWEAVEEPRAERRAAKKTTAAKGAAEGGLIHGDRIRSRRPARHRAETTYGTFVAPTKFIEFTKESLVLKKTTAQSAGIAAGRLLPLSSRRVLTRKEVSGSFDMEIANKGMGLILQALMGTTVTPVQQAATTAYLQTHTLARLWPARA
jgi:hypothetical protein